MIDPSLFLDEFVVPSVHEWRDDQLNIRRAVIAISQLDCLAEHSIVAAGARTRQEISIERTRLGGIEPMLAVARDVHDTHKHGALSRKTAKITQGQGPKQAGTPMGLLLALTRPVLVTVEDAGTEHLVEGVVETCLRYWSDALGRPRA